MVQNKSSSTTSGAKHFEINCLLLLAGMGMSIWTFVALDAQQDNLPKYRTHVEKKVDIGEFIDKQIAEYKPQVKPRNELERQTIIGEIYGVKGYKSEYSTLAFMEQQ